MFVASVEDRGYCPSFTSIGPEIFNKIRKGLNAKLKLKFGREFEDLEKKNKFLKHYDADLVHPGYKEGV